MDSKVSRNEVQRLIMVAGFTQENGDALPFKYERTGRVSIESSNVLRNRMDKFEPIWNDSEGRDAWWKELEDKAEVVKSEFEALAKAAGYKISSAGWSKGYHKFDFNIERRDLEAESREEAKARDAEARSIREQIQDRNVIAFWKDAGNVGPNGSECYVTVADYLQLQHVFQYYAVEITNDAGQHIMGYVRNVRGDTIPNNEALLVTTDFCFMPYPTGFVQMNLNERLAVRPQRQIKMGQPMYEFNPSWSGGEIGVRISVPYHVDEKRPAAYMDFGSITVYAENEVDYHTMDKSIKVEINWPALGSQSLDITTDFKEALIYALTLGREIENKGLAMLQHEKVEA